MNKQANKKQYILVIYLVLIVAVITAYEPIRHNDFISYDDPKYVTENPQITGGLTAKSVIWAFTKPHAHMYHPLTTLSHMLDCELFWLNPFWHHADSLLFHTFSTLLLFWVFKKMTGAVWASAFVAAVFAVHPLQVESVAWAAERKSVLSGFFWILTIIAYVHYAKRPRVGRYLLVAFVYILALLSKPVVVTLPFVLLLLDYWPLQRLELKREKDEGTEKFLYKQFSAKHLIMEKLPLFVLSAFLSVITFIAQLGTVSSLGVVSIKYRFFNAFITYLKYVEKTILPRRLAIFYPHYGIHTPIFAAALCALVLIFITIKLISMSRAKRYLAVGWLWFVGTLIPVIGIVQVGSQAMANRYMYIPIIGLSIMFAWGVRDITEKLKYKTVLVTLSVIAVLLALVITTRRQVGNWRNSLTIYKYTLDVTDFNPIIRNNYGAALLEAGKPAEALIEYKKSVDRLPTNSDACSNLGNLLIGEGKFDEAIECFQKVLEKRKDSVEAYYYLGLAYLGKEQPDEAARYFNEVLRLAPDHAKARNELKRITRSTEQTD